jgi:hypothetical protein
MTESNYAPGALEVLVFDRRFRLIGAAMAGAVGLMSIGFIIAANRPTPRPIEASSVLPAQAYRIPIMRGLPAGFPVEPRVAPAPAPAPVAAKVARPTLVASRKR